MNNCTCRKPAAHKCQKCSKWYCKGCIEDHRLICGIRLVGGKRPHLIRDVHGLEYKQVDALLLLAISQGDQEAKPENIARLFQTEKSFIVRLMKGIEKSEPIEVYIISKIKPWLAFKNSRALLDNYPAQKQAFQEVERKVKKFNRMRI